MERLSELMDGELNDDAIDAELNRIKGDPEREAVWETYHLIGDALRGEDVPVVGIGERVHALLANEPTVLASRKLKPHRVAQRLMLPLAASVCGIAVVAWLALSNNPAILPASNSVTPDMLAASLQEEKRAEGSEADSISEYLMAHQQFSPSTTMQGVVPYVRTVSSGDSAR
jgi:sigma-E factor negative regulatory protein RseA